MTQTKTIYHAVEEGSPTAFCGQPLDGPGVVTWMQWRRLRHKHLVESRCYGIATFDVCPDCWKAGHDMRKYLG